MEKRALIGAGLLLAVATGASAQSAEDRRRCSDAGTNPAAGIDACDRLLQGGIVPDNARQVILYSRGTGYYKLKLYDRALRDYDEALRINPNYADVFHNRGVLFYDKGDYAKALQDFTRALSLKPDNSDAYYMRGKSRMSLGDADGAILDYNQALRLDPADAQIFRSRGVAYYSKENYDRALPDFDRSIQLQPSALAFYDRGLLYGQRGDLDRAIRDLQAAIQMDSTGHWFYHELGVHYFRKGDYAKAATGFADELAMYPKTPISRFGHGVSLKRMGRTAEGDAEIQAAKRLMPEVEAWMARRGVTIAVR